MKWNGRAIDDPPVIKLAERAARRAAPVVLRYCPVCALSACRSASLRNVIVATLLVRE